MTTYNVQSYFINVHAGDAAVHVLRSGDNVLSTVLIDAGKGTETGLYVLKEWIYNKNLKFDAVVITHWDSDHYRGLVNLFQLEFDKYKGNPANWRPTFFKYDANGAPQTRFYCPYFDTPPFAGCKKPFNLLQSDSNQTLLNLKFQGRNAVIKSIAKMCTGDLLGQDFFNLNPSDAQPSASEAASFKSPVDLATWHKSKAWHKTYAGAPGLYCVGQNNDCIGPSTAVSMLAATQRRKSLGIVDVLDNVDSTPTNQSSLAAMVIWDNGQLSLYTAGDRDDPREIPIVTWTGTDGSPGIGKNVTTCKLSHHGASTSSPQSLFSSFNPQNLIVSAGTDYGHPRWEIVMYTHAWNEWNRVKRQYYPWPNEYRHFQYPLAATNFPYWLAKDSLGEWLVLSKNKMSTTAFDDPSYSDFQEGFEEYYNEMDALNHTGTYSMPNAFAIYTDDDISQEERDSRCQWITKTSAAMWTEISNTPASAYPVMADKGLVYDGEGQVQGFREGNIKYIQVTSTQPQNTDGQMRFVFLNNSVTNLPRGSATPSIKATMVPKSFEAATPVLFPLPLPYATGAFPSTGSIVASGQLYDDPNVDPDEAGNPPGSSRVSASPPSSSTPYPSITWPPGSYIYSTRVTTSPSGAGITAKAVSTTTGLASFLAALRIGLIALSSTDSDANPWTPLLTTTPNSVVSELNDWFNTVLGVVPDSFCAKVDASGTSINDMQLSVSLFGGQATFNVASVAAAFKGNIISPWEGIVADGNLMILAMDPRPPAGELTTTLSALTTYVSFGRTLLFDLDLSLDCTLSQGNRNGIWFDPGLSYSTTFRTYWTCSGDFSAINTLLGKFHSNITAQTPHVIAIKKAKLGTGGAPAYKSSLTIEVPIIDGSGILGSATSPLMAYLKFKADGTDLVIACPDDGSLTLTTFIKWIMDLFTDDPPAVADWLQPITNRIKPRQMAISIDATESLQRCEVKFEVDLSIGGVSSNPGTIASLFSFSYNKIDKTIAVLGTFLPRAPPVPYSKALLSGYEKLLDLQPTASDAVSTISLNSLLPNSIAVTAVPSSINLDISAVTFSASYSPTTTETAISISAVLESADPAPALPSATTSVVVPHLRLGLLQLGASYSTTSSTTSATTSSTKLSCEIEIAFTGTDNSLPPALLIGTLTYTTVSTRSQASAKRLANLSDADPPPPWQVSASIQQLQVATILELFEGPAQDAVSDLIGHIKIDYADLVYNFGGSGTATDFTFTGNLTLAELDLTLNYSYPASGQWMFHGNLTIDSSATTGKATTIQSLLTSLQNDAAATSMITLPDYVGSITLSGGAVGLDLWVQKSTISGQPAVYAVVELTIGDFDILFVQFKQQGATSPKRLFRAAVTGFPELGDNTVPIIGKLPQPFDEMYFLYVSSTADSGPQGVTKGELDALAPLLSSSAPLVFKSTSANPKDTDILITPGAHFVIENQVDGKPTAILDYAFSSEKSSNLAKFPSPARTPTKGLATTAAAPADPAAPAPDPGSGKAPLNLTIGFLTISNIGLKFDGSKLGIMLDATFKLGPIELDLIGFELALDLANCTLSSLSASNLSVGIKGLILSFSQPPTSMAGMFEIIDTDLYAGGLSVTFQPYVFTAAGAYGTITINGHSFKTVAVFAQIQGPIVELEFAEISGLCGGFGYNSHLRLPDIDNVNSFPLVAGNTVPASNSNALDIFKVFEAPAQGSPWIIGQEGSDWLAAGLTVTALQTLSLNALVVVEFDPSVKLGIYGNAIGSFPPKLAQKHFVYVELGIACTVDFAAGSMIAQAKLAPASYILDPSCHLTGGFALCYWFGSSAHAGDWVFTIGGYHPAYTPPTHYPVPARLAISWTLDSSLSVLGQAYCAVTPKCCMTGGSLQVSLSLGNLLATFSAWADFLLNFEPFWYQGSGGVSVHVQYTLDLWIVTKHIDIEIGATLQIMGPSTHGTVHVNFWVFGFDVNFGNSSPKPQAPLSVQDFYSHIVKQTGSEGPQGNNQQTITCQKGLVAGTKGSLQSAPAAVWNVRGGGMTLSIKSPFPFTQASITQGGSVEDTVDKIYSKPMWRGADRPLSSTMQIDVVEYNQDPAHPNNPPTSANIANFGISGDLAQLPTAVWGPYVEQDDPVQSGNNQISTLLDGTTDATMPLMTGITVTAPPPTYAADKIGAFNVLAGNIELVPGTYNQYNIGAADTAWLPADPLSSGTGGTSPTSTVSSTAAAKATTTSPTAAAGSSTATVHAGSSTSSTQPAASADPDPTTQYGLVETKWAAPDFGSSNDSTSPQVNVAQQAADLWTQLLQWKQAPTPPNTSAPPALVPLKAGPPSQILVPGVFEMEYLAAPFVTKEAVAGVAAAA